MEEDVILEEQPSSIESQAGADCEIGQLDTTGSSFGKFKDAQSLYDAYNELEKEFTRKCQKLSAMEKSMLDNAVDTVSCDTAPKNDDEWHEMVNAFLSSHKNAQTYSHEIAEALLKDSDFKKDSNSLERAYIRVMEDKFDSKENILKDEQFVNDYILNDDNIKQKILSQYLDKISRVPKVLGDGGSQVYLSQNTKPKTLSEAKKIVEGMMKK